MSDSLRDRSSPPAPAGQSGSDLSPARERGGEAKARQILDGARAVFLRDGFDGSSMNDIAREAGVSKGTLYVYFPSKEALFAAYIREDRRRQAEQMIPYAGHDALDASLLALATHFMREMLAPAHVAQVRTVTAAAAKFPEIGRAFYEAGPGYGQERIAALLAGWGKRGELAIDEPLEAAIDFVNLMQGDLLRRALFGAEILSPQAIDATVRRGVGQFLRLYREEAK